MRKVTKIKPGDHRCACGKLQFRGLLIMTDIEIKCVRCSKFLQFRSLYDIEKEDTPFVVVNENAEVICFSKTAPLVFGYTPEQAAGLKVKDFQPVRRPRLLKQIFKLLWKLPNRDDYIFRSNITIPKIDGSSARVTMTSKMHTINNDLFAICSAQRVEQTPEPEEFIDIDGEFSDRWDCVIDGSGQIVDVNPDQNTNAIGFSTPELMRMKLQDLFPEDDAFNKISAGLSHASQFYLTEQQLLTATGKDKRFFIAFIPHDTPKNSYKIFFIDAAFYNNNYFGAKK